MIHEVVILNVKDGQTGKFEADFSIASDFIASAQGYISHSLGKCLEKENRYILHVKWESLEDHMEGFRNSEAFREWRKMLHHYYDPFPVVEHYIEIFHKSSDHEI